MIGPRIVLTSVSCFTFWFSAFGADGSNQLRVLVTNPISATETGRLPSRCLYFQCDIIRFGCRCAEIWALRVSQLEYLRPEWNYGQVQIGGDGSDESVIVFEGRTSVGGFAVDDVALYEGVCQSESLHIFPSLISGSSSYYFDSV